MTVWEYIVDTVKEVGEEVVNTNFEEYSFEEDVPIDESFMLWVYTVMSVFGKMK